MPPVPLTVITIIYHGTPMIADGGIIPAGTIEVLHEQGQGSDKLQVASCTVKP
jgi:hypothetical protein